MKYLPHFLLVSVTALSLASCAAPGGAGGASAETKLGPHSAQSFTMLTHTGARTLNENDPNYIRNLALVVKVEQQMVNGQQEITASAGAHRDGPTGALVSIDGLRVHVLQPVDFGTEPRKTGGARITQTVPAPGGKYKTVVAEATINSPDYTSGVASVTIPGDQ
ncbi:MAG: hypothetical protein ABI540_06430 [Spartobacteria bacterium]